MWVVTDALIELSKIRCVSSFLQIVNEIIPNIPWICLLNLRYLKQVCSGSKHAGYVFQSYCYVELLLGFIFQIISCIERIAVPRYRNLVNMFILRVCSLLATTRSTGTTPETFGASMTSQLLLGLGTHQEETGHWSTLVLETGLFTGFSWYWHFMVFTVDTGDQV